MQMFVWYSWYSCILKPMMLFRLDLFIALTLGGKELELFEEDTGCNIVLIVTLFIGADHLFVVWLGSLTVTCRTCNPEVTQGRRFDAAPGHCRVTTLGKLFTHMCLCHQAV